MYRLSPDLWESEGVRGRRQRRGKPGLGKEGGLAGGIARGEGWEVGREGAGSLREGIVWGFF